MIKMQFLPIVAFVVFSMILGQMPQRIAAAEMNDMSAEEEDPMMAERMTRRSEVSRALSLLKKHLIVGKDAKFILKSSGKNLLVDPSDRLQIVHDMGRRRSASLAPATASGSSSNLSLRTANKNDRMLGSSSNKNSKKSSKLSNSKKSSTRKRSSSSSNNSNSSGRSGSRANKALDQVRSNHKRSTKHNKRRSSSSSSSSSSSTAFSSKSIELIQKAIMNGAASRSPVIVDSLMATHMLEEMSRLVTAIVRNKRANSLSELSDLITETLDERYGPHWHTITVASQRRLKRKNTKNTNLNEILVDIGVDGDQEHQLSTMTHIAIDDHRKAAIFYATFDFGNTLRIFIFK